MSTEILFLHTSYPDEITLVLKDYETLEQVDPDLHGIQSYNLLTEYQRRPKYLKNYCLADFAPLPRIVYPANIVLDDPYADNIDDNPLQHENKDI